MNETEALELYNKLHREKVEKDISELEKEIQKQEKLLVSYQERREIDHISYWDMDGPDSVRDVEDRKKLVVFFAQHLGHSDFRYYVVEHGLFYNADNIIFLCDNAKLECPQWFLDKYQ